MKKLSIALLVIAGLWALWPNHDEVETADSGHTGLFDRVWIDHLPQSPKEKIQVLAVLKEIANIGVFEKTSAYEGAFSVFEWTTKEKGQLSLTLLQSEKRAKLRYRVTREGCEPFDLCLEVKGAPMGAKRYGSMEDWVIKEHDPDAVRALVWGSASQP